MEEAKFRELIQKIILEDPGISFTDNIMNVIQSGEELSLHPVLLPMLKNELLIEPSPEFSDKLMSGIQPKVSRVADPIISKKAWAIIAAVIASIFLAAIIGFRPTQNHHADLSRIILNLSNTTTEIINIANTFLPYLAPLSILLFLDYFFRTRQSQSTITDS